MYVFCRRTRFTSLNHHRTFCPTQGSSFGEHIIHFRCGSHSLLILKQVVEFVHLENNGFVRPAKWLETNTILCLNVPIFTIISEQMVSAKFGKQKIFLDLLMIYLNLRYYDSKHVRLYTVSVSSTQCVQHLLKF